MSSNYSPDLRIELIGTGDQAGVWGTTTNNNLAYVLEQAIAGYVSVSVVSANQALTYLNGASTVAADNQSVYSALALTTTTIADFAVYAPPASKQYTIYNASAYVATIYNSTVIGNTTAAGTGVAIPAGKTMTVWSDGTNFAQQNTHLIAPTVAGGTLTSPTLVTPALAGETFSLSAAVTAGTNAQGQGALTSDINVVTTAAADPSGVTLPTATAGRVVTVINKGANPINVYPATGGSIDAIAINTFIQIPVGSSLTFRASSITQWYSTATGDTGTGANARAVSPTLTNPTMTTPALGTPASGVLTNATGLPLGTGVTGTLPVANGGTGAATLTANNVLLGNGTSALQAVAPGTAGNLLTSDGTTWTSSAASAVVTSVNGATGAVTVAASGALCTYSGALVESGGGQTGRPFDMNMPANYVMTGQRASPGEDCQPTNLFIRGYRIKNN